MIILLPLSLFFVSFYLLYRLTKSSADDKFIDGYAWAAGELIKGKSQEEIEALFDWSRSSEHSKNRLD